MAAVPAGLANALQDRFRLDRELGQGGMATVYLAHDLKHDRDVALKVLRPELAAVLGRERFLAEIHLTAKLDHPHILTLIDSGESDGFLWYVVPFIRGESLRQKLTRDKQLGVEEALAITRQIAGALDYAHRQGVIHRDIKPENILLQEGQAVLADFGIALAVKEAGGNRLTETGLSLGTPQYMSPEQATGDRQLDARSDVYSLAAVLYEMLAGEPPHTGATVQAVIAKLMTERPTRLRVVRDTVPEGIDNAVARALAKVPADRFANAAEMVEALGKAGSVTDSRSRGSGRRLWAGAAALFALIVVGAFGVRSSIPRRKAMEYDRVQLTTSGQASLPVISPDGEQVAYGVRQCSDDGACQLSIVERETGSDAERPLVESGGGRGGVRRWGADGRRLLLYTWGFGRPGGSYAISRLGGRPTYLGLGIGDLVGGSDTALVPAGFVALRPTYLRLFSLSSSQPLDSTAIPPPLDSIAISPPVGASLLISVRVSPTGQQIALAWESFGESAVITLHDRSGVKLDSITVRGSRFLIRSLRWAPDAKALLTPVSSPDGGALLRIAVNQRSGHFGRIDTLVIAPGAAGVRQFDLSSDGHSLVYDSHRGGESVLRTLERTEGGAEFRILRTIRTASGGFDATISLDGRSVLYSTNRRVGKEDRTQYFLAPFTTGDAHAITPGLSDVVGRTQDSLRFFVATRVPGGHARITAYDLKTGRSVPFSEEASDQITLWRGPAGGIALLNGAGDTLRILDRAGTEVRRIALPDSARPVAAPVVSPQGDEYVLFPQAPPAEASADGNFEAPLYRVSATTGQAHRIALVRLVVLQGIAWTDDGWIHFRATTAGDPQPRLYRVRADGGPMEPETSLPFGDDGVCSMSGSGLRWTCVVSRPLSDIYLIRNFDPGGH